MSKILQERGFGSLPSSIEANPRDQVNSISTIIEADSYPIRRMGSSQYVVSTGQNRTLMYETKQMTIPFLSRLNGYYYEEKKGSYGPQFSEAYSKASHINKSIPIKEKDLGSFTLPCFINNVCFDNTLADLRASVSVMPLSTYLNLGLGELAHTKLTIELADRTVKYPKGIAENVLVGIGKFVFPVDFIILDMPEDIKVPLILGRPFLSTAHAKIDVFKRKITLRVGEEIIIFKSVKLASSLIKRVYMLELNDLNVPLELRRDQVDDLMPTIEEGEVVEEFRARNDARMDKLEYKGNNVVEALMNIPIFVGTFSILTDFAVLEDMDAYRDKGMGDIIFGKPFLREVRIKARRFDGMITIHNGGLELRTQICPEMQRWKNGSHAGTLACMRWNEEKLKKKSNLKTSLYQDKNASLACGDKSTSISNAFSVLNSEEGAECGDLFPTNDAVSAQNDGGVQNPSLGTKEAVGLNGPALPMVTDPPPANSTVMPAPRKKLDSEFNDEKQLKWLDTITLNSFSIKDSSTKEDDLLRVTTALCIGNESIHDYFVRFHKLVNDMKITQLEIPTHQMNTKFVNNLPAYLGVVYFPQTNKPARTSSTHETHAIYWHEWHIVLNQFREISRCKSPRGNDGNSQYFKDKAFTDGSLKRKEITVKSMRLVQIVLWSLDSGVKKWTGDYKWVTLSSLESLMLKDSSTNLFLVGQYCDGGLEVAFRQHSCSHIRNYDMVDLSKVHGHQPVLISLTDMIVSFTVLLAYKASSRSHGYGLVG
ncbi:hypothetical protein Tco_0617777 [Tanacetum coccineum]